MLVLPYWDWDHRGLKYAAIITIGSALVGCDCATSSVGERRLATTLNPLLRIYCSSSPEEIFSTFARHIGIGGIAMAGIIGIINSWGIIKEA